MYIIKYVLYLSLAVKYIFYTKKKKKKTRTKCNYRKYYE